MSTTNETHKKSLPFGGILLIIIGLFLLLQQIVDFSITGGVFFAGLGLFFILWGAASRNAGLLIPGGLLTGLSLGVFLVEDTKMIAAYQEGGVFLLSLGAGFGLITLLTKLFADRAHWWASIVAAALALIGFGVMIVESPNTGALKDAVEMVFNASQYIWPVALVGLGIWIIFKKRP